jgi:small conductance mechanosensitive channel
MRSAWPLILTIFLFALVFGRPMDTSAQDQPPAEPVPPEVAAEGAQEEVTEPAATDTDTLPQEMSESEQLINLEETIESDKKKLIELQKKLKELEDTFGTSQVYNRKAKENLERMKKELQELGPDEPSSRAEALTGELKIIEQDMVLLKQRIDLLYQSIKTTKEQIRSLSDKRAQDLQTLERLRGSEAPEAPVVAPSQTPPPTPTQIPAVPLPGLPIPPPTAQEPGAKEEAPSDALETAEQIEARKEAEKKAEEAREAAEVIVEFVERKAALDKQIALEKQLLNTAKESLENYEGLLATREKLMGEKIAAGAGKAELKQTQQEILYVQAEMEKLHDEIDERSDNLTDLQERLQKMQAEQIAVMERAERKRSEAEQARKKSTWLESPLHPRNVVRWSTTRAPRMLAILVAAFVILVVVRLVLKRIARVMMMQLPGEAEQKHKRATTLGSTLTSAATGVIVIGGVLMALEEAGVDIRTVLGGAAVIGLAVAFGAQNLMRDYFNGFMILMEGQFELNDIVTIGNITGVVERMSMRLTVLRDLEGSAHFIPNGQIRQVTNLTHAWSRALFEIAVPNDENVDHVMEVLMGVADEFCQDPEFGPFTAGKPEMLGVDDLGDVAFRVKFFIQTKADKRWPVRREMLRRIKNKLDEMGIQITIPQRVVFQDQENQVT